MKEREGKKEKEKRKRGKKNTYNEAIILSAKKVIIIRVCISSQRKKERSRS